MHADVFLPQLAAPVEVGGALLIVLILLSSIDDLAIDALYWLHRLQEALGRRRAPPALSVEQLRARRERPLAIMVPAWHESDVIASMIDNTIRTLEYANYMIFVGTYPNDPETALQVDLMALADPRVRRVQTRRPGPTCKADCLNSLVAAIREHESRADVAFAGLVMHDSEDAVHALELRYFNALLGRHDMIQLPVVALEHEWHALVAGTYMDEFAEAHGKDMLVRQRLCGSIPSAGVGTCFSRRAMQAMWERSGGQPFRTDSLTEDYHIGMQLAALDMRATFLLRNIDDPRLAAGGLAGLNRRAGRVLAVREYFPASLRAAYRQRARWMLGIGLQSWHHLPLKGRSWAEIYMMLHDRKGVVTAFVPIASYLLLQYFVLLQAGASAGWWAAHKPYLLRPDSPWQLGFDGAAVLVTVRSAQRMYFTAALYGWKQGVLALPRMVVGNVVNAMAACRAWRLYLQHRFTGRKLAWDKTNHQFPALVPPAATGTAAVRGAASLAVAAAAAVAVTTALDSHP